MEFEQAKKIIIDGLNHPYVLVQDIHIYNPSWGRLMYSVIKKVEDVLNDEKDVAPLSEEDEVLLAHGSILIPAIMLDRDDEEGWQIGTAVGAMLQNYSNFFESEKIFSIAASINKLIYSKNSLNTLLIQTEGVLLQLQSALNNSETPYKLSRKFMASLFNEEKND